MNAHKATTYLALTAALMALGSTAWAAKPTPHQLSLAASHLNLVSDELGVIDVAVPNAIGTAAQAEIERLAVGTYSSGAFVFRRIDRCWQ